MDALIEAIDKTNKASRRDYVLLLIAFQKGLRVSELIGLRRNYIEIQDLEVGTTKIAVLIVDRSRRNLSDALKRPFPAVTLRTTSQRWSTKSARSYISASYTRRKIAQGYIAFLNSLIDSKYSYLDYAK